VLDLIGDMRAKYWALSRGHDMVDLKINEIADHTIRQRWLRSQRDEGRPTEDDIVREHFGPRGEKKDDPNKLPLEANTRWDWAVVWPK
jgi:hypothetical protein